MSMLLSREARGGDVGPETVSCPLWFTHSDSKVFREFCADLDPSMTSFEAEHSILTDLEHTLGLSLQPQHTWQQQARWQPTEALVGAVRGLLSGLDAEPNLLERLTETDATDEWHLGQRRYFTDGGLRLDLVDLQAMLAWAEQTGAQTVRLIVW